MHIGDCPATGSETLPICHETIGKFTVASNSQIKCQCWWHRREVAVIQPVNVDISGYTHTHIYIYIYILLAGKIWLDMYLIVCIHHGYLSYQILRTFERMDIWMSRIPETIHWLVGNSVETMVSWIVPHSEGSWLLNTPDYEVLPT